MFDSQQSVAFFAPGWPPGSVPNGIVTYVGEIRRGLEGLGITTHVVTSHVAEPTAPSSAVDLSTITPSLGRRFLLGAFDRWPRFHSIGPMLGLAVAQAATKLGTQRLGLLEMEETFGAAWYAQQVLDVPVVVRLHGPAFLNRAAMGLPQDRQFHSMDRAERRCIASAAGVTAPSRDVLARVRERFQLPLPHAQIIPNPAPAVPAERRWRLEESDQKTILFVGRFDRHKAGDIMIDAFREVAAALPHARLTFVGPDRGLHGSGGGVQDLPSYLQGHLSPEVRARVQVTGELRADQIETLRRRSYVTVVPSRYETFGLAMVEALAHGCPTIASRVGAIPEILNHDDTGLLFENGDSGDLAQKILTLFQNPARAADLGRRAAADIGVRLSSTSVARTTLDYYEGLLARGQRRPLKRRLSRTLYTLTGGRDAVSLRSSL